MIEHNDCNNENGDFDIAANIHKNKYEKESNVIINNVKNTNNLASEIVVNNQQIASKDSQAFNLQLIQLVKIRPSLYDLNSEGYKSNDTRNREWIEIASILHQNVEFVRTRWKTMRDRFKKEYRKYEKNLPIIWPHFYEMTFVLPFFRARSTIIEDEIYFENENSVKLKNFNDNKLSTFNTEINQTFNNSTTNYIIDFARNVVNNGNTYLENDDGNTSEIGEENILENDLNKTSFTPTNSISALKSDFDNIDQQVATTSTVVTTTLEKPFNFAHFNNLYQNGESIHSKNQFITQTHHQKFENYLQFGKQSSNFFSNNNYNSFFHKNGYKRKCTSGDKQYLCSNLSVNSSRANEEQQNSDDEDDLFCQIMLKKMHKMTEHTKEKAKAKILDILVQFQYGELT